MKLERSLFFTLAVVLTLIVFSSCTNNAYTPVSKKVLRNNWFICNADSVPFSGQQISSGKFKVKNWYPASVPTTVLHVLVKNGVYKNIFRDDNLREIPTKQFKTGWWYRTVFSGGFSGETVLLDFKGINYKANIWLNGKLIADTSRVRNAFLQYQLNISSFLKKGKNILAVEVFPPKPGDFTMGFVDWNPKAPDGDMGIFRPVFLEINKGVGISKPFVVTQVSKDLSQAELTASVEVTNYQESNRTGKLILKVNGNELVKPVTLAPGETKEVIFSPKDYPELKIKHPRLWWPYTLGTPYLYKARFVFRNGDKVFDKKSVDFGIRTVLSYFTKQGFRGFKINGKKILIRGGGWADRLLLDDTPESVKNQLEYVKNMGLNAIRLEGFWGNSQAMYTLCDKLGILVMVGWSCQWEWQEYLGKPVDEKYGGILSPSDMNMMSHAWKDQIVWLRNHPSIFVWLYGSDKIPNPVLEKKYLSILTKYDSTRVHLASAKEWTSLVGPTGVKMRGPYAYEPPVYWFQDTLYGGAFGFNTETGPGAQVPPLESLKKMFSEKHLWPIDSVWDYHCAKHTFGTVALGRYTRALDARYGKAVSVKDYAEKAQVMNYELMRPMFEAFSAYRYKATGVIQWMLNAAWPKLFWQLYDYYLMPNGAYYGAQKASRPYHAIYDYAHHAIYVVNDKLNDKNNYLLKIRVYNDNSVLKFEKEIPLDLKANSSRKVFVLPERNWGSPVYFLDLRLINKNGKEIDNNFYWLSAKKDILNYKASTWYETPTKQYADFTALNTLPKVKVAAKIIGKTKVRGNMVFTVELKNNSKYIAFFEHTALVNKSDGQTILPVFWSDNDVSLLPGETRILTATIHQNDLKGKVIRLVVKGYNE